MNKYSAVITLVLKAVALGMAVASIVLGILGVTTLENQVNLLGIGVLALAIAALQTSQEEPA